jgi:hypothetical protein
MERVRAEALGQTKLAFDDFVNQLYAGQDTLCVDEALETKHRAHAAFYPPVILFDDVVQVGTISNLDGIVPTVIGKSLSEAAMGWLFSSTALSGYVDVSTSNREDWSAWSSVATEPRAIIMDFASVANSADRVAFNFAFDTRLFDGSGVRAAGVAQAWSPME